MLSEQCCDKSDTPKGLVTDPTFPLVRRGPAHAQTSEDRSSTLQEQPAENSLQRLINSQPGLGREIPAEITIYAAPDECHIRNRYLFRLGFTRENSIEEMSDSRIGTPIPNTPCSSRGSSPVLNGRNTRI